MWFEIYVAILYQLSITKICKTTVWELFQSILVILIYLPFIFLMFPCFGFIASFENFSLIWRRQHYRWKAKNFDLSLAPMTMEQWGFFSVPQLLWQGASVYNSHLLPSVWLWSCTYLFLRLMSFAAGIRTSNFRLWGQCSNPLRHRRGDTGLQKWKQAYVCGLKFLLQFCLYQLFVTKM